MVQNKNQGQQQDARQQNQDDKLKNKNQELPQDEQRSTARKGDKNTQSRKDTPQGRKQ